MLNLNRIIVTSGVRVVARGHKGNYYISQPSSPESAVGGYYLGTLVEPPDLPLRGSPASLDIPVFHLESDVGEERWVAKSQLKFRDEITKLIREAIPVAVSISGRQVTYDQVVDWYNHQVAEVEQPPEPAQKVQSESPEEPASTSSDEIAEEAVADWQLMPLKDGRQPMHYNHNREFITDGVVSIPVARPFKRGWKKYGHIKGLSKISEEDWSRFLDNLIGSYLLDVIEDLPALASPRYRQTVRRSRQIESRVKRILDQPFFDIPAGSEVIAGRRTIVTVEIDGVVLHVMGAQMLGIGTYVFPEECLPEARQFAAGQISAKQAAKLTVNGKRVNKRGENYKNRLHQVIEDHINAVKVSCSQN